MAGLSYLALNHGHTSPHPGPENAIDALPSGLRTLSSKPSFFPYSIQFLIFSLSASFPTERFYIMNTDPYQIPGEKMDFELPVYGDDLPEGEPSSSAAQQQLGEHSEVLESTSTASAPMRQRRAARVLPTDTRVELRNKDLQDWNTNYRVNMKAAARLKIQNRAATQAKKNAEHYVWGSGLGGIAKHYSGSKGPNPFDMFIGDNLYELVTGVSRKKVAGTKHDRDSGIDDATQRESRRVRQKTGEPEGQVGRGTEDEGLFLPGADDIEVELPRSAASALDDDQIFSAMPWNISASKRESSAIPRSGRVGTIGSVEQGRHGSRLVSASPLHGRGQPSALEGLRNLTSDADYGYNSNDFGLPGPSSDFPMPPAAPQETSTRVQDALSAEGENFLTFVTKAIVDKRNHAQANLQPMSDILQAEAAADIEEITLEELLPAAENTKMIACQGLMMVLALGTKGMLDVQQPEHFGEINLKLTERAKAIQVVEISDGEASEDESESEGDVVAGQDEVLGGETEPDDEEALQDVEMQQQDIAIEEEGHFQEQFAAGHAAHEDHDHDSLYDN
jgi:peroxiredoxin family protein